MIDKSPKKQDGIQLLRVLMMFWIIMFHFADHGVTDMNVEPLSFNWGILAFARMGGGLANAVFVLISGYFLFNKKYKIVRILKLWIEVWFYSIIIGIFCFAMRTEVFSIKNIIKMIFPVTYNEYWYMSTYFLLYFFIPFLNKGIASLSKKQYQYLLVITLFFFSILPTFSLTKWTVGSHSVPIFFCLYLLGGYIGKYNVTGFKYNSINGICSCLVGFLIFTSEILFKMMGSGNPFYMSWEMYKTPIIVMAIFVFLFFKNIINYKAPKFILAAATSIFGVYLFHMGRLSSIIFKQIFNNGVTYKSYILIIQMLGAALSIMLVGVALDQCRIHFIEKPLLNRLNKKIECLDKWMIDKLP